jgi:hypothetical protein
MAARCRCAEAGNAEAEREPSMKDTNPNNPASNADLEEKIERLTRELSEAQDQLKATSELLRVISNSPAENLQSALEAIAERAARLLDVADADIMRLEGDGLREVVLYGRAQDPVEARVIRLALHLLRHDDADTNRARCLLPVDLVGLRCVC